jgi:hypothetical protein
LARLIANQELEKQAKINAEELKKEKTFRKKERIGWITWYCCRGIFIDAVIF